ncbi:MAG: head GIN domain-containing protein [Pseudomonadota bacterium]
MRTSVAVLIAATATVAGCGRVHAEGGGPTVSRTYQVGNFQQIEVAGPYEVEVRTGGKPGVSARGAQKLLEKTMVEVKGDKLVIRPQDNGGWFHFGWHSKGKAVFAVTVPKLSAATIAGSGDIKVDKVQGDSFDGTVAGSGGLNVAALDVQSLKLSIAGSGGVKAASGRARSASYDIAGSGDIDAGAVAANDAKVSIAGSGSVRAHATGTADVSIMGSGDVQVGGGAKCSVHKSGSGDVRCS